MRCSLQNRGILLLSGKQVKYKITKKHIMLPGFAPKTVKNGYEGRIFNFKYTDYLLKGLENW